MEHFGEFLDAMIAAVPDTAVTLPMIRSFCGSVEMTVGMHALVAFARPSSMVLSV